MSALQRLAGESVAASGVDTVSMCSFRVGAGLFGIDTQQIVEVLGAALPQPVPLAPEYIAGVLPYRGEVLTTVSFRALLGLEIGAAANCVLVVDDEEHGERFGLMVDAAGGMVTMDRSALEANPGSLDALWAALFDGVFRTQSGLMVHLDPRRLRPTRLARSGLFGMARKTGKGEPA
jgi:purine-binding chemotaxis protein CheW